MSAKGNTNGGISFLGLLTIMFIGLKLCDVIDWSWWWVLSPLWIPITIAVTALGVWLTIIFLVFCFENKRR